MTEEQKRIIEAAADEYSTRMYNRYSLMAQETPFIDGAEFALTELSKNEGEMKINKTYFIEAFDLWVASTNEPKVFMVSEDRINWSKVSLQ